MYKCESLDGIVENIDDTLDKILLDFIPLFKSAIHSPSKINDILNLKSHPAFFILTLLKIIDVTTPSISNGEHRSNIKRINNISGFMQKLRMNSTFFNIVKKLSRHGKYHINLFIFQSMIIQSSLNMPSGSTPMDIINFHKSIAKKVGLKSFVLCKKAIYYPSNIMAFTQSYSQLIKKRSCSELNRIITKNKKLVIDISEFTNIIYTLVPNVNMSFKSSFDKFIHYFSNIFKYVCTSVDDYHYVQTYLKILEK